MTTRTDREDTHEDLVTALLDYGHHALAIHDAALERLEDSTLAAQVDEFRTEHARCIADLGEVANALGLTVPGSPVKSMLASGKIALADIAGDRAILQALQVNERLGVTAYEGASASGQASEATRDIAREARTAGRRRREWLTGAIERLAHID